MAVGPTPGPLTNDFANVDRRPVAFEAHVGPRPSRRATGRCVSLDDLHALRRRFIAWPSRSGMPWLHNDEEQDDVTVDTPLREGPAQILCLTLGFAGGAVEEAFRDHPELQRGPLLVLARSSGARDSARPETSRRSRAAARGRMPTAIPTAAGRRRADAAVTTHSLEPRSQRGA
jgi:hypothetical protein